MYPGGMGNYMQPSGYPGGNFPLGMGYPGAVGYPGQMQPRQGYQSQAMPGRMGRGQYNPGVPAYGQMPGQYPASPAGGMRMPSMAIPGMTPPGVGSPGMTAPGIGGRTRRPGIATRMATQQQTGMPASNTYNQTFQPAVAPQPGMAGKGLRLGKRSSLQAPMQAPMFQGLGQPGVSPMGKPIKPKQFNLKAAGMGQSGTGIATINDANTFSLIANNLPDPAGFPTNSQQPPPVYVAYLTNRKGQGSFSVGQLYPLGGGTYRAFFQSNVPFYDYDQVVVSLENPYSIGNAPIGPVVLASATGAGISLPKPVSNFFSSTWEKIKGVGKGLGKKNEPAPEAAPAPEATPPSLLNGYTLGPPSPPNEMVFDLPGLGVPAEDPSQRGNP